MDELIRIYYRLLANTPTVFRRYLYDSINWQNRLILIKGARGVGKTTLLLQHIREAFPGAEASKALYVSLDNVWFAGHHLVELAEYHYTHGGTHLFMDEVHKLPTWSQELKSIYDSIPDFHVVATGSSMLRIEDAEADLSRRCRTYDLAGLSFREFAKMEAGLELPCLTLDEILSRHTTIAMQISSCAKVLPLFETYMQNGVYPYFTNEGDGYADRLRSVISSVLEADIPATSGLEYDSVIKAKRMMSMLAEKTPFTLNVSDMTSELSTSRANLLKMFSLMHRGRLMRILETEANPVRQLAKPAKVLFDNANILYALSPNAEIGTARETFFASQMSVHHDVCTAKNGDFVVDHKYTFEVGGRNKKFSQIKDVENSYVVADGVETGHGNRIPLWMFGLTY